MPHTLPGLRIRNQETKKHENDLRLGGDIGGAQLGRGGPFLGGQNDGCCMLF